ncbi:MFS domain-containing protein [Sergentomyia squamirostris]
MDVNRPHQDNSHNQSVGKNSVNSSGRTNIGSGKHQQAIISNKRSGGRFGVGLQSGGNGKTTPDDKQHRGNMYGATSASGSVGGIAINGSLQCDSVNKLASNNSVSSGAVDDPETKDPPSSEESEIATGISDCGTIPLEDGVSVFSEGNCHGKSDGSQETTIDVSDEKYEEIKPLLHFDHHHTDKYPRNQPKSIVKSPSTQSFRGEPLFQKYREKPRLSLQCGAGDAERPVLHVQFLQEKGRCSLTENVKEERNAECNSPIGSLASRTSSSSSSSDEESGSLGQYAEARAPDGGWGWVVVAAAFMVNLIADGITFSFGVIFVEFLAYFREGKAKTAWIGSLFMAMPLLSGPIASFLTDRYGCRRVTVAGSILAASGFVMSAFSDSMEMLFFTFGILAGFGLSLCYVAAVVIVAYYFDKRRSFATGLSVCGSGIGTFIFAPLTQVLLEEYGWRGTTLILAGVFLNMIICGLLMRDLEWTTHRAKKSRAEKLRRSKMGISADSMSNSTNTGGTASNHQHGSGSGNHDADDDFYTEHLKCLDAKAMECEDTRQFSSLIALPTFVRTGEKVPPEVLELLSTHKNAILLHNYQGMLHSRSFSEPLSTGVSPEGALSPSNPERSPNATMGRNQSRKHRLQGNEQELLAILKRDNHQSRDKPTMAYLKDLRMHRHSLTYRGAMLNINRYRLRASSCPDIYRNSMTTIAKEKTQWYHGINEFKNLFVDILDFSHLTDIRFLLFALSNFLLYTWYDVPYVYLADNAIGIGFSETDASVLISIIGIVNMFGEISLGWIGDRKWVNPTLVYALCMLLCGAVVGLVPLLKSYQALSAISGAFGLFIAANYSLTSIILVELITLERFTNAYGLLLLIQGIANLVGPPLAGWIYDITGTYEWSFYLAGFFIAISGAMLVILPAVGKYKKYRALKRQNSESKNEVPSNSMDCPSDKSNGTTILSDCFRKDLGKGNGKIDHV